MLIILLFHHLEHLESLRERHVDRMDSWVGCSIQNQFYLFLHYLKPPLASQFMPIIWKQRMLSEKRTGVSANESHPCLMSTVPQLVWRRFWISRRISVWKTGFSGRGLNLWLFEYEAHVLPPGSRCFVEQIKEERCDSFIEWVNPSCAGKMSVTRYCCYT